MRSRPRARRRARYAAVEPGYHANKRHWNSVHLDRSIEDVELQEMIDHSYTLIVNRLPRAERARIQTGHASRGVRAGRSPLRAPITNGSEI